MFFLGVHPVASGQSDCNPRMQTAGSARPPDTPNRAAQGSHCALDPTPLRTLPSVALEALRKIPCPFENPAVSSIPLICRAAPAQPCFSGPFSGFPKTLHRPQVRNRAAQPYRPHVETVPETVPTPFPRMLPRAKLPHHEPTAGYFGCNREFLSFLDFGLALYISPIDC